MAHPPSQPHWLQDLIRDADAENDWLRAVEIGYLKDILWAETNKGCEISVIGTRVLKQEVDHWGWMI